MTSARVVPSVHWPVLELLFEPGAGDELSALVRSLADLCRPVAPDHTVAGTARLLSSPFAPESYLLRRDPDVPYAVVVRDRSELDHPISRAASCVVLSDAAVGFPTEVPAAVLSPHALRSREILPVPCFVREALRRRHGLPDRLVLTIGRPGERPLGPRSLATGLRLAAAADVCGPVAVQAMALATPIVTDAATASLLGAEPDVHVVVADASRSSEVAADLATDRQRCARLGRAGRRLIEARHDSDVTARELVAHLGMPLPGDTPAAPGFRLGDRLAELGTPTGHALELQFAERLADLGVAPRTAGSFR